MITGVLYNVINTNTKMVHGISHTSFSLCGIIHSPLRNRNINLEKTNKKIKCKKCLRKIDRAFRYWAWQFDYNPGIESFDENIHSQQLAAPNIFNYLSGLEYVLGYYP